MEAVVLGVILALGGLALIAGLSLVSGTIVWLIWPIAMKAFPGLVLAGYVSADLNWPTAVCLAFLFSILIKSTQANTKNSD